MIEAELSGIEVLVGMDIIGKGDFAVTSRGMNTIFSFRMPSLTHIDFVKEYNKQKKPALPKGKLKTKKRRTGQKKNKKK